MSLHLVKSRATLPAHYTPPRLINGRLRTCRLVEIGLLHKACAKTEDCGLCADRIQCALLDKRTAHQLSPLRRVAGAVWRWL